MHNAWQAIKDVVMGVILVAIVGAGIFLGAALLHLYVILAMMGWNSP